MVFSKILINNDVEKWFDTSNFDNNDNRPLLIGKNKKFSGKFRDELGGKIITEFCALKPKNYAYKLDNDNEVKKAEGTKKCIVKRRITFDNYVDILFNSNKLLKSQFTFTSDLHDIYTQKINKIALNYFDDKRIQVDDKITTYPYGYFDNDIDINFEIKNNTDKLNEIDNSGIIPKNYNTKKENSANVTLDIRDITNIDYLDSVKSFCVDSIKSTNANNTYVDSTKITCVDKIKSANANNNYLDSAKSSCLGKTKSNNLNNAYLTNTKSTYVHRNNVKSVHSNNNIIYELNKTLKIKRVTDAPIIVNKKSNFQAITIAYEFNKLRKLKKVSNPSQNVIDFRNKDITQIINNDNVYTCNNITNTTNAVIYNNIIMKNYDESIL